MKYYQPYVRAEEKFLPEVKEGDVVGLKHVFRLDKFTSPPPRYNPSSLLKKMEDLGIGTKATRADIVQTLYNRKYVKDERLTVTELGFDVINVLGKYAPAVTSVKLTQELESKLEQIQNNQLRGQTVWTKQLNNLNPTGDV
jgi:DNA topoisomerase-1